MATNSRANASYFRPSKVPGNQLLGVHGLATQAGASSHVFIRTPQHKGHPHPVLSLSTSGAIRFKPLREMTEAEAREYFTWFTGQSESRRTLCWGQEHNPMDQLCSGPNFPLRWRSTNVISGTLAPVRTVWPYHTRMEREHGAQSQSTS